MVIIMLPLVHRSSVTKETVISEAYLLRRKQRFRKRQRRGGRSSGPKRLRKGSNPSTLRMARLWEHANERGDGASRGLGQQIREVAGSDHPT